MTSKNTIISAAFKAASLTSLTFALLQSSPKVADGDAMLALLVIGIATSWCAGMYDTSGKKGYFIALLGLLLVLPALLACTFALIQKSSWRRLGISMPSKPAIKTH